jgi:hypothetical protein
MIYAQKGRGPTEYTSWRMAENKRTKKETRKGFILISCKSIIYVTIALFLFAVC